MHSSRGWDAEEAADAPEELAEEADDDELELAEEADDDELELAEAADDGACASSESRASADTTRLFKRCSM